MKTAGKNYKREWEEAQLAQLIQIAENSFKALNLTGKVFKLFLNLTLFITYLFARWAWNLAKLALFSQPYTQIVRDEQWIYRQIK